MSGVHDLDAIRREFAEFALPPAREADDVDVEMLAQAFGISQNTAREKMRQIAAEKPDVYSMLEVFEKGRRRWVLRRRSG